MKYAALLLCLTAFAQEPPATARIQGRVIDSEGKPVPRATVTTISQQVRHQQTTLSGDDGAFIFNDVPPGPGYYVAAQKTGYLTSVLGEAARRTTFPTFPLKPGETFQVVLRLAGQGVVVGQVTTPEGDPVARATVQLRQPRYTLGFREVASVGTAQTDDRGRYRILGLTAGYYYLLAAEMGLAQRPYLPVPSEHNITTFYPGVATIDEARQIEVSAGNETTANFRMLRSRSVTLRATLLNASGVPMPKYDVVPRRADTQQNTGKAAITNADGELEIVGLEPGNYTLEIVPRENATGEAPAPRLRIPLSVGAADANGVILRMPGISSLSGTVQPEEGELKLQTNSNSDMRAGITEGTLAKPPLAGLFAFVAMAIPGTPSGEWRAGKLRADGSFTVEGLDKAAYQLELGGIPEGYYIKSVRQGDADVTHKPVQVPGDPLRVILSAKGAEVSGTLSEEGLLVALWPDQSDAGSPLHGIQVLNGEVGGAFRFVSVPPGSYRLAAFRTAERGVLWNHEFLSKFAGEAAKIEIAEGVKVSAEPPLLPAARFQEEFVKLP